MTESHDLALSVTAPDDGLKVRALVVGVLPSGQGARLAPHHLPEETAEGLQAVLADLGITGARDEVRRLPGAESTGADVLVLVGMGELPEEGRARLDALRYAAGSAIRQLHGMDSAALDLPAGDVAEVGALAEGAAFGAFVDPMHRTSEEDRQRTPVGEVVILTEVEAEEAEPVLTRALILGEAVDSTRRLVNEAPNHLYPDSFAGRVLERVAGIDDVEVEVLDEEALAEGGFGGILGVGRGSHRPPRLVVVDYRPEDAGQHMALVGKGITFDSGGLSLKPGTGMMTMKSDMAGAAAVLNTVAAAAELRLPLRVTGYLCLAENLPGGGATRPEDVLVMRGGTTVEVLNTDAEGRLVMADGLAYASEQSPDCLLDVATLTGAQVVALGERYAAVMGEESLRESVAEAGAEAGEPFWPMPLPEELRAGLKSPVADLKNIGAGRAGGMLTAGLFLQRVVGEVDGQQIPWAHLDIAGPSFNEGSEYGFTPKQGTGVAVRTLVTLAERIAGA
ncbi:leucyl aminopeptidase [Rothia kristinae]|uniref:leucyl aminopeptidase n=1 Tax=Rothia kristinae TaxID=37923 RepID=UPI0033D5D135